MADERTIMAGVIMIMTGLIFLVVSAGVLDIAYAIVHRITTAITNGTATRPLGATAAIVGNINLILTIVGIIMLAVGGGMMIKFLLDMTRSARQLEAG